MSRITSFTGPRVQAPATPTASSGAARTGFGSLLQPGGLGAGAAPASGKMSGGQVVASALAASGGAAGSGVTNAYQQGSSAAPGSEQAQAEAALQELGTLSAITFSKSIIGMAGRNKIDLERE
ncbi:MAG TPA: hypothetical protein VE153_37570 [Myxococcus sp.]|nr:hypothetical protein [Myxococcus sp.]